MEHQGRPIKVATEAIIQRGMRWSVLTLSIDDVTSSVGWSHTYNIDEQLKLHKLCARWIPDQFAEQKLNRMGSTSCEITRRGVIHQTNCCVGRILGPPFSIAVEVGLHGMETNPPPNPMTKNSRLSHQHTMYAKHFLGLTECHIDRILGSWWNC